MVQTNNLLAAVVEHPLNPMEGPGIPVVDPATSVITLETTISRLIGILTIIGVIYFVIQIIIAGFSFMSAKGDPKNLETSRKRITNNIIGLAVIVLAYGLGGLIASLLGISDPFNLDAALQPIP